MNEVILVGRLSREPNVKESQTTNYVKFAVAVEYQRMSGRDAIAHDYEKVRKEIDTALQEEDAYYR